MNFHQATLDNGLTIIGESNAAVQSVALGFFVRAGSRDESPEVSGVSHFLEHMAFKGNDRYTAEEVNRIFDDVGARHNAQTSEEVTLYYAAILPEYLPQTFDVLAGLLYPSLRQEDFDIEKNVILEEIGMYDDQPSFTAYEKAMEAHFAGHPLGQSILGSVESVGALTSDQMRAYHHAHYVGPNITLAVAGNFDWSAILDEAQKHCAAWPGGAADRAVFEARPEGGMQVLRKNSTQQVYVMQMAPAPPADDDRRFAAELLAVIVGDDTGSRMYWELVDPGHAESAELGYNEYEGSGAWLTYLGCDPEQVAKNLERTAAIYAAVNRDGVTEVELEQAKNKVASRVVLRGERPMGRLSSLGSNWVYRREYRTVEDDLRTLRAITLDDIRGLLAAYPLAQTTTIAIGPRDTL